jgi:hypothetical protein
MMVETGVYETFVGRFEEVETRNLPIPGDCRDIKID